MTDQIGKMTAADFANDIRKTGATLARDPGNVEAAQQLLCEVQTLQQNQQLALAVVDSANQTNHTFQLPFTHGLPNLYLDYGPGGLSTLDIASSSGTAYHFDRKKMIGWTGGGATAEIQRTSLTNYALLKPNCGTEK